MLAALSQAGWNTTKSIVENLITHSFLSSGSPFSIDYEFYGQYMWNYQRDKVRLEKWGNIGLSRTSFKEFGNPQGLNIKNFEDYASLSLHSYL
jgi:hypothetical protein